MEVPRARRECHELAGGADRRLMRPGHADRAEVSGAAHQNRRIALDVADVHVGALVRVRVVERSLAGECDTCPVVADRGLPAVVVRRLAARGRSLAHVGDRSGRAVLDVDVVDAVIVTVDKPVGARHERDVAPVLANRLAGRGGRPGRRRQLLGQRRRA
jgi:hypothetical protein